MIIAGLVIQRLCMGQAGSWRKANDDHNTVSNEDEKNRDRVSKIGGPHATVNGQRTRS